MKTKLSEKAMNTVSGAESSNRSSSRMLTALAALVLCLSLSIGITLAYFSDYEEAAGGAELTLGGQTELKEGSDSTRKDIVIENTGETDMIVRLAIYQNDYMTITMNSADWEPVKDSNGETFYYYKKILGPGARTSEVVADLRVEWEGEEPEYNFDVTVVHESAQAVYTAQGGLVVPDGWDAKGVKAIDAGSVQSAGEEG